MANHRAQIRKLQGTGLIVPVLAVQSTLMITGYLRVVGLTPVMTFYGIVSLLAIGGTLLLIQRQQVAFNVAVCAVSIAIFGPFGLVGYALLELVRIWSNRKAVTFEAWYERLFPRATIDRSQALYALIAWKKVKPNRVSTVAPFIDVLDLGTIDQKQSVITLIADHFKPELAPALQCALNDAEPAIRVQAATAAARIENHFLEHSVLLQRILAKEPDNPSILRKMAIHHETYARSGMLDAERAASERMLALDINMKLLSAFPRHLDLVASAAKLLLELGRPEEAARLLMPWIRTKSVPQVLAGSIAEALFRLKRLALLRRVSGQLIHSLKGGANQDSLRESLLLWNSAHG